MLKETFLHLYKKYFVSNPLPIDSLSHPIWDSMSLEVLVLFSNGLSMQTNFGMKKERKRVGLRKDRIMWKQIKRVKSCFVW